MHIHAVRIPAQAFFDKSRVSNAATRVAMLPIIASSGKPVTNPDIRQPKNNPGIAAAVKHGNIVNASDILTCITPDVAGKNTVSTV